MKSGEDNQKLITRALRRKDGMSPEALATLRAENAKRTWWGRCWSCKRTVEGTLTDLSQSCPHCGVSFRQRQPRPQEGTPPDGPDSSQSRASTRT